MNKHYSTSVKEEGAQAERLAKMNFQILERIEIEARLAAGVKSEEPQTTKEEEEEAKAKRDKDKIYYQLNLHVNELREPRYSTEAPNIGKPCENFNRFYLPNGQ
jgi:hypothetical protein